MENEIDLLQYNSEENTEREQTPEKPKRKKQYYKWNQ